MNFQKKSEEEDCFINKWKNVLLAPPLLHIFGLRFLHLLLTSAALFFSSFFFIDSPPPSVQSPKQDQDQDQDHDYVATDNITGKLDQYRDFVSTKDITGKLEDSLEMTTNEEDEEDAIPDDESLIELSLPSGRYIGHNYTSDKNHLYLHNKVQHVRLFDLFNELNDFIEEDNLIEIDISIGSIKYSRFEVKA